MAKRAKHRGSPSPRKRAASGIATDIVDAILRAASELLERDGVEGLTTNAVARAAGVSVGSLYQYFPDKIAIVAELARRIEATAIQMAGHEAMRLQTATAREAVARITRLSCSLAFGSNGARRALLRDVPRGWILRETQATDALIGGALAAFYAARPAEHRPIAIAPAVFVQQHAVEGVVETILLAWPDALSTHLVQRELFHLGWAYIAPDGGSLDMPLVVEMDLPPLRDIDVGSLVQRLTTGTAKPDPPTPKRARGIDTRDAIVHVAEHVLAERGFDALSVRAIAKEAGVSIGAVYHHFDGVEAIIASVAEKLERRAADELNEALEGARDRDAIAAALIGAYLPEPRVSVRRALLVEVPRRWIEPAALHGNGVEHLSRALAECTGARPSSAQLLAFVVLHAVKSASEAFALLLPIGVDADQMRAELRELITRYLR